MKKILIILLSSCTLLARGQDKANGRAFLIGLDSIRTQLKIPGMAAAARKDSAFGGLATTANDLHSNI